MKGWRVIAAAALVVVAVFGIWWFAIRDSRERVLLVGDSLMRQTAPTIEAALGSDVNVRAEAVNGTGLLSRPQYDWLGKLPGIIDDFDPKVVVVSFNGNCATPVGLDPSKPIDCDTPQFYDQWAEAADRATTILESKGAKVFWVTPPPELVSPAVERAQTLGEVYRALAARRPEVGIVDGYKALAYEATQRGPDGNEVPLRAPDTVHFTEAGAQRFAYPIVLAVGPLVK
jgi:hypothetical protein